MYVCTVCECVCVSDVMEILSIHRCKCFCIVDVELLRGTMRACVHLSVFMTELHVEVTVNFGNLSIMCVYLYHMSNLNLTEEHIFFSGRYCIF